MSTGDEDETRGESSGALTMRPIGYVRAPFEDRAEAPRQPRASQDTRAIIELLPGHKYDLALNDLAGWEYLWVLFWFHKNRGWRPMVLPPRSERRRGVFSTRTPHRPNPLGLSVVKLERVEKLEVHVVGCDMLDGTPVFDLKPYVPWADAIPNARTGWLAPPEVASERGERERDAQGRPGDPQEGWEVHVGPVAREQLAYLLAEHGFDLEPMVRRALELGPKAHPYRRIKREGDAFVLGVKAWRARFSVEGRVLTVLDVRSGYRPEALAEGATEAQGAVPEREGMDVHRAFVAKWGAQR